MALDVGEKRIGIAVSDSLGLLARPLKTIPRNPDDVATLEALLAEYEIDVLVIGYPRSLSGAAGPQAQRTQEYADRLAARLPVQIVLWDERYTTCEAVERLAQAGRRRRGDKGRLDAAAAAVILQDYLDSRRGG